MSNKACGNADCMVSTGIDGNLTFGSGNLCDYGYWDYPCEPCARAHEEKYPEDKCWPYKHVPESKINRVQMYLQGWGGLNVSAEVFERTHGAGILGKFKKLDKIHLEKLRAEYEKHGHSDEPMVYCVNCSNIVRATATQSFYFRRNMYWFCKPCMEKYIKAEYVYT